MCWRFFGKNSGHRLLLRSRSFHGCVSEQLAKGHACAFWCVLSDSSWVSVHCCLLFAQAAVLAAIYGNNEQELKWSYQPEVIPFGHALAQTGKEADQSARL